MKIQTPTFILDLDDVVFLSVEKESQTISLILRSAGHMVLRGDAYETLVAQLAKMEAKN